MPQPNAPFVTPVAEATFAAAGRPALMITDTTPTILQANEFVFAIPSAGVWDFSLDATLAFGDPDDTFTSLLNFQQAGPTIPNQPGDSTDSFSIYLPATTYTYGVVLSNVAANVIDPVDFGFAVTLNNTPSIATTAHTATSLTATATPGALATASIYLLGGTTVSGLTFGIRVHNVGTYTNASTSTSDSHTFTGLTPATTYDIQMLFNNGTTDTSQIALTTGTTDAGTSFLGSNSQLV